jgi:hypothetical protein
MQGKSNDHKCDRVIGGIAQKIERIGAQADRSRGKTGDKLDAEHYQIDGQCYPQDAAVAMIGCGRRAIVTTATHGTILEYSPPIPKQSTARRGSGAPTENRYMIRRRS